MRLALLAVLFAAAGAACFSPQPPRLAPCETDTECPSPQTCRFGLCSDNDDHGARISFTTASSLEDELSGTVTLTVTLSEAALVPVAVTYDVTGGTATLGVDYTFTPGALTFAPGETEQSFSLSIAIDAEEESDETIELALTGASGAVLANASHMMTISANVLARAALSVATASGQETEPGTIDVVLDAPSGLMITVDYTITGTATDGGVDHTLVAGTLTYAPGETMKQLPIGVVNDALDEDDETVIVTLGTIVNGKVGDIPSETYTILDEDPMPTVRFGSGSGTVAETTPTLNLNVQLSAPSGKVVTVAFTVDPASTATATTDYSIGTTSPITFMPGDVSQDLTLNIVDNGVAEADETIIVTLTTPTNATLGTPNPHTRTILDNDRTCYGTGNYTACVTTPTVAVMLPSTLNTDASALCQANQPVGWAGQGQPAVCVVAGTTINIPATTTVTGTRPLLLAATDITIGGVLDVSSRRGGTSGPGSNPLSCGAFPVTAQNRNGGAGGGAGGTFTTKGGNGGSGDAGSANGGQSPNAVAAPTVLRGGCDGQLAGNSGGDSPGAIGRGGGAVYLLASNGITITGAINASGSAGTLGQMQAGGSGAGSGGMIKLYSSLLTITGATLIANGGGGAGGGGSVSSGASGSDPSTATPTTPAAGGVSSGGDGGSGFAGTTAAVAGVAGTTSTGGGGGGGGGGFIQSNLTLVGANVSAGIVSSP